MNFDLHRDHYRLKTDVDATHLQRLSQMVAAGTGLYLDRRKPIVGVDALKPNPTSIVPNLIREKVGEQTVDTALDSGMSRPQVRKRLESLGYTLEDDHIDRIHAAYKSLAQRKARVYDRDLVALMFEQSRPQPQRGAWALLSYQATSSSSPPRTARVSIREPAGRTVEAMASGDGAIGAVFKAIAEATSIPVVVDRCVTASITEGGDAQIQVILDLLEDNRIFRSRAVSTDSVEAAALACVKAINDIYLYRIPKERRRTQSRRRPAGKYRYR